MNRVTVPEVLEEGGRSTWSPASYKHTTRRYLEVSVSLSIISTLQSSSSLIWHLNQMSGRRDWCQLTGSDETTGWFACDVEKMALNDELTDIWV